MFEHVLRLTILFPSCAVPYDSGLLRVLSCCEVLVFLYCGIGGAMLIAEKRRNKRHSLRSEVVAFVVNLARLTNMAVHKSTSASPKTFPRRSSSRDAWVRYDPHE